MWYIIRHKNNQTFAGGWIVNVPRILQWSSCKCPICKVKAWSSSTSIEGSWASSSSYGCSSPSSSAFGGSRNLNEPIHHRYHQHIIREWIRDGYRIKTQNKLVTQFVLGNLPKDENLYILQKFSALMPEVVCFRMQICSMTLK